REGLRDAARSGQPHRPAGQARPGPAQPARPDRRGEGQRARRVSGLGGGSGRRHQAGAGPGRRVDDLRSAACEHSRDGAGDGAARLGGQARGGVIRSAREADRPAIEAVTLAAYEQYAAILPPRLWREYRRNIVATLADATPEITIVAEAGGALVGSVLLQPAG